MKATLSLLLGLAAHAFAQPSSPPAATPPTPPPPKLFAVRLTTGPAWDAAKGPNEQAGMRAHSANIVRMRRDGVLVTGARFGELGLMVLRVPDEAAARAQFTADPTIAAGTFKLQVDEYRAFAHGNTAYPTSPEATLLRGYLDAFNRHEPDAVAAFCAGNFKWHTIDGDKSSLDADGRIPLRDWLVGYFKSLPDVRSEFLSIEQTGPYLAVRERASWDNKEGKRVSQQALCVYEIRDGLIQRVWYFPSVKDAPPPPAAK